MENQREPIKHEYLFQNSAHSFVSTFNIKVTKSDEKF